MPHTGPCTTLGHRGPGPKPATAAQGRWGLARTPTTHPSRGRAAGSQNEGPKERVEGGLRAQLGGREAGLAAGHAARAGGHSGHRWDAGGGSPGHLRATWRVG